MWELWLTIAAAVAVLVVISVALLIRRNKKQVLSNSSISTLAIVLAVLGVTFSDDPLIRYSFFGTTMILAVIYAVRGSRKK